MKAEVICLYCPNPTQGSDEHVVSDTLGPDRTIPWVCKACNTGTSDLDRALSRESLLVLPRLMRQPDAVHGYSSFIEAPEFQSGYVDVEFRYPLKAKQKSQLAFAPKTEQKLRYS